MPMTAKRIMLYSALFVLWLGLSVGVGVAFLAVKHAMGWGFFSSAGFHAFAGCMASQMQHAAEDVAGLPKSEH